MLLVRPGMPNSIKLKDAVIALCNGREVGKSYSSWVKEEAGGRPESSIGPELCNSGSFR